MRPPQYYFSRGVVDILAYFLTQYGVLLRPDTLLIRHVHEGVSMDGCMSIFAICRRFWTVSTTTITTSGQPSPCARSFISLLNVARRKCSSWFAIAGERGICCCVLCVRRSVFFWACRRGDFVLENKNRLISPRGERFQVEGKIPSSGKKQRR